ncbi:MAG: ComF family protein [Oleiphilaceae bacterium]|nr:ComF family protein [Oleiphilaceae bacterium]
MPLAMPAGDSMVCGDCIRQLPPFQRVIAPWRYEFPVNRLISRYKYSGQRALGKPLIDGLVRQVAEEMEREPGRRPDVLVPSPMHPARQRRRGFNQAEDIAESVSRAIGVPWSVTLVRRRQKVAAQSELDRAQRLANLRQAFSVSGPSPGRVAIIDDVITTGATARTLASVLSQAGARHVEIWALARTPL